MAQLVFLTVNCGRKHVKFPLVTVFFTFFFFVSGALSNVAAGLDQGEEESASEDSGCETSLDQGSIMDFSASSIAEQLTQMDSVRHWIFFMSPY